MYLILTVQSLNNGNYRFGLSQDDFNQIMKNLNGQNVFVQLPGIDNNIEVAHLTFLNEGNLFANEISNWIIHNNYINWEHRNPFKLVFRFQQNTFTYYNNQAH